MVDHKTYHETNDVRDAMYTTAVQHCMGLRIAVAKLEGILKNAWRDVLAQSRIHRQNCIRGYTDAILQRSERLLLTLMRAINIPIEGSEDGQTTGIDGECSSDGVDSPEGSEIRSPDSGHRSEPPDEVPARQHHRHRSNRSKGNKVVE